MWPSLGFISLVVVGIAGQILEDNPQNNPLPQEPTVVIGQGSVVGSLSNDGNYVEFYGIPYADATSGSHRFKAPRPAPSFQSIFAANRENVKCVRALGTGYEGTEDCLVANIFTPSLDNNKRLSVMVWVKGKEFDSIKEPNLFFGNFVEKEVVVVSLNYRESILGFLCLGTETAPGNAGLKDIVAGLKWIKENIAQFGGNPDDITLVGHGSGAAAVDLVTMSPMGNGMVNKVIIQSGSALSPWAVSRDNLEYAIQVAEALGHRITTIEDISDIFKRTSVAALMGVINELDLTDNSLAFAPCLERPELIGDVPFLVKSPYEALKNGEISPVPIIIGFVDNEGTIRSEKAVKDGWLSRMDESFEEFLQPDLKFDNAQTQTEIAQRIREQYFQNDNIDEEHIDNYVKYHGDTMILVSTLREVRFRVTASDSSVFVYQFSYRGSLGEPFIGPLPVNGAAHSEELAYLFFDKFVADINQISDKDLTVGDLLVERWTNFAKTGLPQSETSQILWRPFTSIQSHYLQILDSNEVTEEATLEVPLQNPHPDTMTFWDEIYDEHFLDAEGKWEWDDRTESSGESSGDGSGESSGDGSGESSGDGSGESSGDGSGESSGDGSGESSGDGSGESSGDGSGDSSGEDDKDSASTAAGYTFTIITLFAIVNKFHSNQILS